LKRAGQRQEPSSGKPKGRGKKELGISPRGEKKKEREEKKRKSSSHAALVIRKRSHQRALSSEKRREESAQIQASVREEREDPLGGPREFGKESLKKKIFEREGLQTRAASS